MKNIVKKLSFVWFFAVVIFSSSFAETKYISPNNDGAKDQLIIPLDISDKRMIRAWSLVILDENHKIVRTIENKVALPEKVGFKSFFKQLITKKSGVEIPKEVIWNGAMDNGENAPDGVYFYYITATDDNGNVGKTSEFQVIIDTVAPEISLVQPRDKIFGEGAKSSLKIQQTGSKEDEWIGYFKSVDGKTVKTYKWKNSEPKTFNWNGTDDNDNQVLDGVYSYEITSTDRAGNVANKTGISNIIYSAEKPATNLFVEGSRYFSPQSESNIKNISLNVTIPIPDEKTGNKLVEWSVDVKNSQGKIVKSFNNTKDGNIPPQKIIFDGLDDNNNLLENGEYVASVNAKYLNGYIPPVLNSPILVLDREKPIAQITPSETIFGAGSKDSVTFKILIAPSSGAPVKNWKGVICSTDKTKIIHEYKFGEYPPETIVWNGLTEKGAISDKGQYIFILEGTDLAGNIGGGESSKIVTFDTTETQILLAMSDSAFSPNGDNKTRQTISFNPVTATKDVVSYEFAIKDKSNKIVYSQNENSSLPKHFVWDGKDNDRILCLDGQYFASLSVTAANGSVANCLTQNFEIDTQKPHLVAEIPYSDFSPLGNGSQKNLPIAIKESTTEKMWNADVKDSKNQIVKKFTWNGKKESLVWDGTDESGNMLSDGKYELSLYSTDDAGNSFETQIKGITLDNRETKAYITAEFDGISPNNDNKFEKQEFEIKTTVEDSILRWNFDIRKEDGTSVFGWSEKESGNLPRKIEWNGADKENIACEGTFIGTLNIVYKNGNIANAISSPFICTATAPIINVQTAPQYFSPDNDGVDDDLFIKLSASTKAQISSWEFKIKDPKGRDFWVTNGKSQITERIIWDGLSNVQKDSNGKAERVQSAMDYPYSFVVSDNLGMTSELNGVISIDVLVIRDGNVLKMAVPSIIFESDAANFQNASAKLTEEQVKNNLKVLNRIVDILKKFKDYKVTISGHANRLTDNPDEETVDNLREWGRGLTPLSKERADSIAEYLKKHGVSASSLSTQGFGGTQPVVNPKDKDNNWKNRRVEFILEK